MLFVSEGIDYDITDIIRGSNRPRASRRRIIDDIRDAIAATARSNVSIYAIDPRGLTTLGDETIGVAALRRSGRPGSAGIGASARSTNELRLSQDSLRALAEETGGFAAVNRNDFATAFDRIVRDNSSYYVLAYYPPSDKRTASSTASRCSVNRPGPDRPRRAAATSAPKRQRRRRSRTKTGGPSPELSSRRSNSPLQVSGLTMRVFAAPFKGDGAERVGAASASRCVGRDPEPRRRTARSSSRSWPSTPRARSRGAQDRRADDQPAAGDQDARRADRLPHAEPDGTAAGPISAARRGARHGGGDVGSVIYDLEVPDYDKLPFSMSGLVMTSLSARAMVTAQGRRAAEGRAAGAADCASAHSRRTTSSRCSPRSTTTAGQHAAQGRHRDHDA